MSAIEINVPDGEKGKWKVESFEVTQEEAAFANMRAAITGRRLLRIDPGKYKRLKRGSTVVMSNTPMEIETNSAFIRVAKGNVLINGLGLGMVLGEILKKDSVKSVTVIEAAEEVISLVGPSFEHDDRVTIIHADAFEYKPPKGARYDAVWHDIWDNICSDNLKEMGRLHRKYGKISEWQGSWAREECKAQRRQGLGW